MILRPRTPILGLGLMLAAGCQPVAPDVTFGDGLALSALEGDAFPGLVGVPNLDDDDRNGTRDWEDFGADDENDLATLTIPAEVMNAIRPRRTLRLTMLSGEREVRVWQGDRVVLGESDGEDAPLGIELERSDEPAVFGVEFRDFLSEAEFELTFQSAGKGDEQVRFKALEAKAAAPPPPPGRQ